LITLHIRNKKCPFPPGVWDFTSVIVVVLPYRRY